MYITANGKYYIKHSVLYKSRLLSAVHNRCINCGIDLLLAFFAYKQRVSSRCESLQKNTLLGMRLFGQSEMSLY